MGSIPLSSHMMIPIDTTVIVAIHNSQPWLTKKISFLLQFIATYESCPLRFISSNHDATKYSTTLIEHSPLY